MTAELDPEDPTANADLREGHVIVSFPEILMGLFS
jgi:hypothetical protein